MIVYRILCIVSFLVVVRGDFAYNESQINLFGGDSESFEDQIKKSLNSTKNFFADKNVEVFTDVYASTLNVVPYVGQVASLMPLLRNALAEESDVYDKLAIAIPDASQRSTAQTDVRAMRGALQTISDNVEFLKSGIFESTSEVAVVHDIHGGLDTIVNIFNDPEAIFRKYPLVAVNILFVLASTVAVFAPIQQKIVPALTKKSRTPCKLKKVLLEYREHAVENRISKIEMKVARVTLESTHFAIREIMDKPFNKSGYNKQSGILTCGRSCVQGYYCLTDTVSGEQFDTGVTFTGYYRQYDHDTENSHACLMSYMGFIRHGIEKAFEDPLDLIMNICTEKNKAETGYGKWEITILESIGRGFHDETCDFNVQGCDPYIKILIDDREVHKTETQWDTPHPIWDVTYKSKRMRKDARITIEIWDDDSGFLGSSDDLMLRWSTSIDELLRNGSKYYRIGSDRKDRSKGGYDMIITKSRWRNEYNDNRRK